MVRLRPVKPKRRKGRALVSIPLWCDCDNLHNNGIVLACIVSIPLWCDCDLLYHVEEGGGTVEFQSHYGAIATLVIRGARSRCDSWFQSHYGAIATPQASSSKMCRPQFQSHYGAIATKALGAVNTPPERFNPTMVRLRPGEQVACDLFPLVSIPLWCDCDQGDIKLLKCLASVNGLGLFRLYFTTFFPFCQIGKVGKVANFAANLRLPLRPWGVDGKRSKRKVGGIFG
jgi:hypothetical protein